VKAPFRLGNSRPGGQSIACALRIELFAAFALNHWNAQAAEVIERRIVIAWRACRIPVAPDWQEDDHALSQRR
jgi:hypothetical protein